MEATELVLVYKYKNKWEVVERPAGDRVLELHEVKTLFTCKKKDIALAWAEGR